MECQFPTAVFRGGLWHLTEPDCEPISASYNEIQEWLADRRKQARKAAHWAGKALQTLRGQIEPRRVAPNAERELVALESGHGLRAILWLSGISATYAPDVYPIELFNRPLIGLYAWRSGLSKYLRDARGNRSLRMAEVLSLCPDSILLKLESGRGWGGMFLVQRLLERLRLLGVSVPSGYCSLAEYVFSESTR